VTSFTYGAATFSGVAGYPYDQTARLGTFETGTRTIYFRFMIRNLPAQSSLRFVIVRPDGTTASDAPGVFGGNAVPLARTWAWFGRGLSLASPGVWTTDVYVNGARVASAPFSVVATAAEIVNRPPLAIASLAMDPPTPTSVDVPFCRVTPTSLYRRDPDYDLVRYRYRWEINGTVIRDVVSAALADAIPRRVLGVGDQLTCTVTPLDDSTAGPSATVSNAGVSPIGSPTGLTASSSGASVLLTWAAPTSGGTPFTYIIEAGTSSGSADLANFPTGTTATTFSATGVPAGTYFVRVRAANAAGTGPTSNEVILVVGGGPCAGAPAAPSTLTIVSVTGGTVVLSWDSVDNATSYIVEAGTRPGATDVTAADLGSSETSLTATSVGGGTYYVRIRGKNLCGVGPPSAEVTLNVREH
jgi:hypothetical protein